MPPGHYAYGVRAQASGLRERETPYDHVIAGCVRRARLWGFDEYAGRDYSHRKPWVLERLQFLSGVFAIDISVYEVGDPSASTLLLPCRSRNDSLNCIKLRD